MSTPSSTCTVVVLTSGAETRVLGGTTYARNARVAARAGAHLVTANALREYGDEQAVLVPADVLIDIDLFAAPLPSHTAWLQPAMSGDRASADTGAPAVLAGPARDVASCADDLASARAFPRHQIPGNALLDVSTAVARRRALWSILKQTGKPTDGWISRHCNRPISRVISFVLLSMGLKAWHASAITLLVGLGAAALALQPGYAALVGTALLFQFASVLDGVDGEMARATLTESESGARLDAIVDQLTYVACFIGVTIGWAREGSGIHAAAALFWTCAMAMALMLSLWRGARFVTRHAPDASFVFIDRAVRRAAQESDLLALRMAAAGFSLLRRDLFAIVFLAVSFTGRRALIPALVGFGVALANVTLSTYRRELQTAAVLEQRV